jgi:hypothetical protein
VPSWRPSRRVAIRGGLQGRRRSPDSGLVTIRTRRSIAVSEPVCEQVVDVHVVIVDVFRHPIGRFLRRLTAEDS